MELFDQPFFPSPSVDELLETQSSTRETLFQPRIIGGSSSASGGGELTGTLITTNATPKQFELADIDGRNSVYIFAKILAQDPGDDKHGAFIRNAGYNNVAGTVSVIGMIQDMYTQRDEATWDVDFQVSGTKVFLRVLGKLNQTINWNYSVLLIAS